MIIKVQCNYPTTNLFSKNGFQAQFVSNMQIVQLQQSIPFHIGLFLRFKDKNTHIILEKPSIICKKFFTKNAFSLNFPISRENRNLEPINIRYDVGHPVTPHKPLKLLGEHVVCALWIIMRGITEKPLKP